MLREFAFVPGFGDEAGGAEKLVGMLAVEVADVVLDEVRFSGAPGSRARFPASDAEVQKNLAQELLRISVVEAGSFGPGEKLLPGNSESEQPDDRLAQGLGFRFNVFEAFKVGRFESGFDLFRMKRDWRYSLEGTPREGTRPTVGDRWKDEGAGAGKGYGPRLVEVHRLGFKRRVANVKWQMAKRSMGQVHRFRVLSFEFWVLSWENHNNTALG